MRSAVFLITFPVYTIQFPPTVSHTRIGFSLGGHTLTMMCEYVTVRPTGIFLREKKEIVFVPFCTFPGKPSASRPNYFDGPFYQGSLVLFLLIALNPCTIIPPLCLYQQLCWISNILRVHIQYLLPSYVLPSELLGLM